MLVVVFVENVTQAVEPALPLGPALGDPALDELQTAGIDPAGSYAPDLLASDDAALLEDLKVLNDGGQSQVERLRQVADRHGSDAQPFHDGSARRLSERVEDAVDGIIV